MFKKMVISILCLSMLSLMATQSITSFAAFNTGANPAGDPIKIEGEWYSETSNITGTTILDAASASQGKVVKLFTSEAPTVGEHYLGYNIVVSKEGIYELVFASSAQGQIVTGGAGADYLSPYSIRVNGEKICISPLAYGGTLLNLGGTAFYKYTLNISLNEGENNIRFVSDTRRQSTPNNFHFQIDNFTYRFLGSQIIKREGEIISNSGTITNTTASSLVFPSTVDTLLSNKVLAYINQATVQPYWTYDVQVPQAGSYILTFVAYPLWASYSSDFKFNINDGDDIVLDQSTVIDLGYAPSSTTPNTFRIYRLLMPVQLNQGINSIKETVIDTCTTSNVYKTMLDYFTFTKVGAKVATDRPIEAESYTGTNFLVADSTTNAQCSNAKAISFYYSPYTNAPANKTATYSFNVAQAGNYDISLRMSSNISNPDFVSPIEVAIDDIVYPVNGSTMTRTGNIGTLDQATFGIFKYNTPIALMSGLHTITVTVTAPAPKPTATQRYYFYLDRIDINSSRGGATSANGDIINPILQIGQQTLINTNVYNDYNEVVSANVQYTSQNTDVATVDQTTGVITAIAKGEATINSTCDVLGTIFSATSKVKVLVDEGIFLVGSTRNDNSVNVSISSWVQNSAAKVILIARDKNGVIHSLKKCSITDKPTWKPGMVETFTMTVDNMDANTDIQVLVWNGFDIIKPILPATKID